jgi:hypothetical protein
MDEGRGRVLSFIADVGTSRVWLVLTLVLLALLASAAAVPGLPISTSRSGLIADDDPQQQRTIAFWARFGRPDSPLFVVSGGTAEERRAAVDALQTALEQEEDLKGRVLGRLRGADVGSVALLHQPDALLQLTSSLPPDTDVAALVESGLPGWLDALQKQIEGGLAGAEEAEAPPDGASIEQAAAGLEQLATLARLLDDVLAGREATERFAGRVPVGQRGIDDHGYLVTDDGEHNLIALYLELDSDEGAVLAPLVTRLRKIRDDALAGGPSEVTAELTGLPALSVDELALVQRGLLVSTVAATIGIFLLCLALFRSVRQTIVALLPLLPGTIITLALVRLFYDDLNLITSSFVAVLLGLGIDFSVHLIARRNEEVRAGVEERKAISAALRQSGPGVFTGAVITAAAFLTTATTDFTAYGELGIITAMGLVVMVTVTFMLIPPLLVVGRGRGKAATAAPEPPGIGAIPGIVRRGRRVLVVVGVLLGVAGAVVLPRIDFDARYFGFLPDQTESARPLKVLEYDALASPVFAALTAESVEEAREMADALKQLDSVAGVQSPSDLLPPLTPEGLAALRAGFAKFGRDPDFDKLAKVEVTPEIAAAGARDVADILDEVRAQLRRADIDTRHADSAFEAFDDLHRTLTSLDEGGAARLAALHEQAAAVVGPAWGRGRSVAERGHYEPEDVPPLFATRYVSRDGQALALYAVPAGSFWEKEVADRFSADVRTVDPDASGLAMVHVEHGQIILAGFRRAALIAAALIVVLLLVDFRSVRDAALALLPTVLGWLWMLAAMAALGIEFNVANIVALPLVLGIGIAFGVHVMHRQRETVHPSIDEVIRGTGGAVFVAATTTMVGFAALILSDYGGMRSLGIVMVIGIATCLIATIFVLPAVLVMLKRAS